jgi:DNA-binding NtrC family response regulator
MSEEGVHVCLVGKDSGLAEAIRRTLGSGFIARHIPDLEPEHWAGLKDWCEVVLLDLRLQGTAGNMEWGFQLLEQIQQSEAHPPIVVLGDDDNREFTTQAVERGAYDTISSPPDILELRLVLQRARKVRAAEKELDRLRAVMQVQDGGRLHGLIGTSPAMQDVFARAKKIAPCDVNVLITGETGTGKELLAQAIHEMSTRASKAMVGFSCVNLPATLLEDELFGHEKGAYTGALSQRRGRIETADRGTLFLDEIGDMDLTLQPKLLRVLQERKFERLGSNTSINVNIRVVSATHRNLVEMVEQGKFREDLYYRLNVVHMHLPPLRERRSDIPLLAQHFLQIAARQFNKKTEKFSRAAIRALEEHHDWPGNVRELENAVQRAVVFCEGPVVEESHLPGLIRKGSCQETMGGLYEDEVRQFKRRLLVRTLRDSGWRVAESARTLGVARGYLHRLIKQLEIEAEELNPPADIATKVAAGRVM